jgi:hypothetical protein
MRSMADRACDLFNFGLSELSVYTSSVIKSAADLMQLARFWLCNITVYH